MVPVTIHRECDGAWASSGRSQKAVARLALAVCITVGMILGLVVTTPMAYASPGSAKSVSQYGITWVFDGSYKVGRYANGDWWVVGPVTITEIQPESTVIDGRVRHGSMIDPVGGPQGFDSFNSDVPYKAELNVDPGATGTNLTVKEGSVVSAISKDTPGSKGRPVLDDLAILTVVDEAPAPDAFRPGPYSEDKTSQWAVSDLDYSVMRSLPMLDTAPDIDTVTREVERFWNEQNTTWTQRAVHAANNQPTYGREIAYVLGRALLALHLDYPDSDKRELFIHMVQRGLDVYDRARTGGVWKANGGHNHGRKMPMLFAGLALDAEPILDMADGQEHLIFAEDQQTFIVSEQDVGKEVVDDHETYRPSDVGMPEWGIKHANRGRYDDRRWGASYRWVGSGFMSHALAAHVMESANSSNKSATVDWNYPPFFEYVDRYEERGSPAKDSTNRIRAFVQEFWDEYRNIGPGSGESSAPKPPKIQ